MTRVALVLGGGGLTGTAFHAGAAHRAGCSRVGRPNRRCHPGDLRGIHRHRSAAGGVPAGRLHAARDDRGPDPVEGARVLDRIGWYPPLPKRRAGVRRPASPALACASPGDPGRSCSGAAAAFLPAGTIDIDEVNPGSGRCSTSGRSALPGITAVNLDNGRRAVFAARRPQPSRKRSAHRAPSPATSVRVIIDGVPYVDGGAHSIHNADLVADGQYDVGWCPPLLSTADIPAPEVGAVPRGIVRRQLDGEIKGVSPGRCPHRWCSPGPAGCADSWAELDGHHQTCRRRRGVR